MKKWEHYCIFGVHFYDAPTILSRLGNEGWELVSGDVYHGHYVMKRPIETEESRTLTESK